MTLTVNGAPKEVAAELTLAGLLESLGVDFRRVAVERNQEIVPKAAYSATLLQPGDRIEIVQFVGGGV